MRAPVPLPAGLQIRHEESVFQAHVPSSVQITRRWLRGKHFFLLAICWALTAALGWYIHDHGIDFWTGFGGLILLNYNYLILAMFVNRTQVFAGKGEVRVSHGPLPLLGARSARFSLPELGQLYAVKQGGLYSVKANLTDGRNVSLVSPLVTAEQALFVEQQIEQALGILDFEVPGELASSLPARVAGASGAQPGKPVLAVAALIPLLIGGGVAALIYFAFKTEVNGSLSLRERDGAGFQFVPSDCRSGQAYGFFGVDVVDEAGHVVRVISDPVQGPVVMVQREPGKARRLALQSCATSEVRIVRTNTTVNDVRVLDGTARLDCPEVKADLSFEGCH